MTETACPDCAAAAAKPWHGFRAGCTGCAARALARSPVFAECKRLGKLTQCYQSLLVIAMITHDEVKAAAAIDKLGSAKEVA